MGGAAVEPAEGPGRLGDGRRADDGELNVGLFRSRRDAAAFLAAWFSFAIWGPVALVLFGWLRGPLRFACLVPSMWAVLSLGFRRERLERGFRRERLLPAGPLGDPRSAAWAELSGREAWESAFEWLGRDRRTGAIARWIAYGFALAALAISLLPPSLWEG